MRICEYGLDSQCPPSREYVRVNDMLDSQFLVVVKTMEEYVRVNDMLDSQFLVVVKTMEEE